MTIMKSLLLVCLCWFPLEICPLARRGNVGEGRDSRRERRGRGTEQRIGKGEGEDKQTRGRTRGLLSKGKRDQGDAERGGKGKEQWGAGKGSLEGGAERGSGWGEEVDGEMASQRDRTWPGLKELQLVGARGRGLISFTNGCEMRLAPLEAVRV